MRSCCRGWLFPLLVLTFLSCTSETAVRLRIEFDDAWGLDRMRLVVARRVAPDAVHSGGQEREAAPSHEFYLRVPDEWANTEVEFRLQGLRADGESREVIYATGIVRVTPELGAEVEAIVSLARVPCGAWCVEGSTSCRGDGVSVCEQRDEDICLEWSESIGCDSGLSCSHGRCQEDCIDECAMGETRCAGPGAVAQCGQADGDVCLDWLNEVKCVDGEVCSAGTCSTSCVDECEQGQSQCFGDAVVTCGDLNQDDCLEWSPAVPCAAEESCSEVVSGQAQCSPRQECQDECSEASCRDTSFVQCGNYDSDPCLEASPGVSCVPSDRCLEGACGPSGCETAARLCNEPPPPRCLNDTTLQTYDSTGSCEADGSCTYAPTERPCANCNVANGVPSCDACEGVSCTEPPGQCFAMVGSCSLGSCSYAPTDGASCDDGNACTENDRCRGGTCSGTAKSCTTAPTSMCVDDNTLRIYSTPGSCTGGTCDYGFVDMGCANCPSCDPCEGVLCNAPPGVCLESSGTCSGGTCSYAERTGGCNDGDACTTGDMCSRGLCAGVAVVCDNPPASECADASTLRTYLPSGTCAGGSCSYAHTDSPCENGCAAGVCTDSGMCTPAGWASTVVGVGVGAGDSLSIAARDGQVFVCYYDFSGSALECAQRQPNGTWAPTRVDGETDDLGQFTSTAIDAAGVVHVSYYDWGLDDLKYARRAPTGEWSVETVDEIGEVGTHTSIAVDSAGVVHIAYYDLTNQDLKHASRSIAGVWTDEPVDTDGDVGLYTAIAVGGGRLHISYYDETNDDLKYAVRDLPSGSWGTETVAGSGRVGEHSSIAVTGSDVHIAFSDITNAWLQYATKQSGQGWTFETIDNSLRALGEYNSIGVNEGGVLEVVYNHSGDSDLNRASKPPGGAWTVETLESERSVGAHASMAIEGNTVHVFYLDSSNVDLEYGRICPP